MYGGKTTIRVEIVFTTDSLEHYTKLQETIVQRIQTALPAKTIRTTRFTAKTIEGKVVQPTKVEIL